MQGEGVEGRKSLARLSLEGASGSSQRTMWGRTVRPRLWSGAPTRLREPREKQSPLGQD